jgi:glycosyltransferase involved in cell wall biosynthesis
VEYIVVDGASTDGTLDIIRTYEDRIDYWMSEPDEGIYYAMNKGIDLATGEWLLFLGSDDIFYTNITLNICQLFQYNNIYYGNVILKYKNQIYPNKINSIYQLCLTNFCHQAIFYHKSIYTIFKYDTQYKYWSDYIYNLNLYSKFRKKFIYLNSIISIFNDTGLGSINKDILFIKNRLDLIKKLFGKHWYYIMKIRYIGTNIKNGILEVYNRSF